MKGKLLMLLNMKTKILISIMIVMLMTSCSSPSASTLKDSTTTEIKPITSEELETELAKEATSEKAEVLASNEDILKKVEDMTLEEKVGQMFIVTPEVFTYGTDIAAIDQINMEKVSQYNIGGFSMFAKNIVNPEQITTLNEKLLEYDNTLFIAVDEEGGQVSRIASNPNFPENNFENMSSIYTGDTAIGYEVGNTIGAYLVKYNFNVDFAPVADILLNNENTVVNKRSFGSDPTLVSDITENVLLGLRNNNIIASAKHFPGHGNTALDTHDGFATSDATLTTMKESELIPFERMIENNIEMVMVGHVIYPNLSEENVPASLNKDIITGLLKEEMGYNGVVITDAMNMGAIANNFTSKESAVKAVLAGNDIILMPTDFYSAYDAIIEAVNNGTISEERINESVIKILTLKSQL